MQIPLLLIMPMTFDIHTILFCMLSGIMLLFAQLGLVKAYSYASAAEVGVYQYSSVVFVGLIEWLLWSITPDALDYVGFVLVSIAGVIIIRSGKKLR